MVGIEPSRYTPKSTWTTCTATTSWSTTGGPTTSGSWRYANASHEGANPLCGDRITLQLHLSDGKIAGVGFTGRGCAISQASASLLTDEIKGKPVVDVAALTSQDVLDLLGIDISPARLKCALLSLDTLQQALFDAAKPAPAGGATA